VNTYLAVIQELRSQDSIPFLRRVSTELQKSDVVRHLSQLDMSDPSIVSASPRHKDEFGMISPTGRRTSHSSVPLDNDVSPREHSFVKTTFSKRKLDFVKVDIFFWSHSVVITSGGLSGMSSERQEKCCSLFTVQSHFSHEMHHKRTSDL
jgi:hypothetical protein